MGKSKSSKKSTKRRVLRKNIPLQFVLKVGKHSMPVAGACKVYKSGKGTFRAYCPGLTFVGKADAAAVAKKVEKESDKAVAAAPKWLSPMQQAEIDARRAEDSNVSDGGGNIDGLLGRRRRGRRKGMGGHRRRRRSRR